MPTPSMRAMEPSPNLTEPVTPESMLENADLAPDMWFDAPVSRTHLLGSRSPASSKTANTLPSVRRSWLSARIGGGVAGLGSDGGSCSIWGKIPSPCSQSTARSRVDSSS